MRHLEPTLNPRALVALTTLPHLAISLQMCAPNCSGLSTVCSKSLVSIFSRVARSCKISALSL